MQREDILVPLLIAALYFAGAFVTASVVLEGLMALRVALVVAFISVLVLIGLYMLPESNRLIGIQIGLGFGLLVFGLIWWVVRTILEILGVWPFTDRR